MYVICEGALWAGRASNHGHYGTVIPLPISHTLFLLLLAFYSSVFLYCISLILDIILPGVFLQAKVSLSHTIWSGVGHHSVSDGEMTMTYVFAKQNSSGVGLPFVFVSVKST